MASDTTREGRIMEYQLFSNPAHEAAVVVVNDDMISAARFTLDGRLDNFESCDTLGEAITALQAQGFRPTGPAVEGSFDDLLAGARAAG
jgi:hypothetical protein